MPQQSAADSEVLLRPLWSFVGVAAAASVVALYFVYRAHEEHANAVSSARELSKTKNELAESLRELERTRSAIRTKNVILSHHARPADRTDTAASPSPSTTGEALGKVLGFAIDQIRRQRIQTLHPIYDSLLTQLNLSPEQRERFYELQIEIAFQIGTPEEMPSEPRTPEEQAQVIDAKLQQNRDSAFAQIEEMLGPGGYQLYQSYLQTQSERELAEGLRQQFDSTGLRLSDSQLAQLREVLIQSSANYPPDSGDLTTRNQAVFTQAAQFLTPEQLSALGEFLQVQRKP